MNKTLIFDLDGTIIDLSTARPEAFAIISRVIAGEENISSYHFPGLTQEDIDFVTRPLELLRQKNKIRSEAINNLLEKANDIFSKDARFAAVELALEDSNFFEKVAQKIDTQDMRNKIDQALSTPNSIARVLRKLYGAVVFKNYRPYENAEETLHSLKEKGYNMHILTYGIVEATQHAKFERLDMPTFKSVFPDNTIHITDNENKVEAIDDLLTRMKEQNPSLKKKNVILIGDSEKSDIKSAHDAGIAAALFDPDQKSKKSKAEIIVTRWKELPQQLEQHFEHTKEYTPSIK